jgi:pectinesterase
MRLAPTIVRAPLVGALLAAAPLAAQPTAPRLTVRVENPLALERRDETIGLAWATVRQRLAAATPERVRVLDGSRELTSQVVDNDGDGQPDELLFQGTFWPKEARDFTIEATAPTAKPVSRAFTRHDDPRDDIAWESDRIAWRMYGEGLKKTPSAMSSSGIDVWAKRTRDLIVEKWYTKGHDAYHVDTGEGADFYDVGETLGAGGTAVWRNDSLYRADNFKAWRIIANGPIRTVFELKYDPWSAGGSQRVSEIKRIAQDAGQNYFRQESTWTASDGADIPYATGMFKQPSAVGIESKAQPWAWITAWAPVVPKNGGHGEIGVAVLLERSRLLDWKETDKHYLAISRAKSGQPVVNYVAAGWTDSGDFRDVKDWWKYLDQTAQKLATPLKVTLGTSAAR